MRYPLQIHIMDIYLVGGAVRDQLLNYPVREKDWVVVGATADDLLALGYQQVGKDFPVFLHPDSKEEYALARTERKSAAGYTGFVCHADPGVTLEQDLQRRDLTINAMAQAQDGTLVDPYGGQRDLADKTLRHVSAAFVEDPLRVLRVARFAARYAHLGFRVAPETEALMTRIVEGGELATLSAERVWREFEKALGEPSPVVFLQVMDKCRALATLMPELGALSATILEALGNAATGGAVVTVRFALLFMETDAAVTRHFCERLRAPNDYRKLAVLAAEYGVIISQAIDGADALLAVIESSDAYRNPERFEALLDCVGWYNPSSTTPTALRRALAASLRVDTAAVAASGLRGKAIATEIHRQRVEAIAEAMT